MTNRNWHQVFPCFPIQKRGRGNGELRCYHGENFTEVLVRANNVTNLPSCVAEIRSGRATSRLLPRVMKAVSQFIANQSLWVDKSKHSLETWHENSQPLYDLSCSPVTWKHPNSSMSLSWISRSRRVEEIISDRMHQRPRDRGWPMGAQVSREREVTLGQLWGWGWPRDIITLLHTVTPGATHLSPGSRGRGRGTLASVIQTVQRRGKCP